MMHKGPALRLTGVQGLLQRVENEVSVHGTAHPPADDAAGKNVDNEGDVQPALPSRDIGKVGDPQLIRAVGLELAIDPIQWARGRLVADSGADDLAAPGPLQAKAAHQSLDGATGYRDAFAVQLTPDLVGAVDLQIGLPDPLDQRDHRRVALRTGTT